MTEQYEYFNEIVEKYKDHKDQLITEMIDKHYKMAQLEGRKKMNGLDTVNCLSDIIPLVRIINVKSENNRFSNAEPIPYFMYYHPEKDVWTNHSLLLNELILKIHGEFTDQKLKSIKNSIIYNENIPLINLNEENIKIVDGSFDKTIDFSNHRFNLLNKLQNRIKPNDIAINQLSYPIINNITDEDKSTIENFFDTIADHHKGRSLALKQICYAALMGYNPTKKAVNFYGSAGTGKSTMLKLITALTSHQYATLSYSDLNKDDALATIKNNKLIVGFDNNDKGTISNTENFKLIVGKDEFTYFVKYGDRSSNIFKGLMIQAFNELPKFITQGSNQQIIDRMMTIHFKHRFRYTDEDNKGISEHITSNHMLGKIAYYLIHNVDAFDEFAYSDTKLNNEIINETDQVYEFIQERIINIPEIANMEVLMHSHLYSSYKDYLKENNPGSKPMSNKLFTVKMRHYMKQFGYDISNDRKLSSYFENRQQYSTATFCTVFSEEVVNLKTVKSIYYTNLNQTHKLKLDFTLSDEELLQWINENATTDDIYFKSFTNDLANAIDDNDEEDKINAITNLMQLINDSQSK